MANLNARAAVPHDSSAGTLSGDRDALLREGIDALSRKAYDKAERIFSAILAQVPEHVPSQIKLAYVHLKRRDFQTAEVGYRRALSFSPHNIDALHGLGTSLQELGKLDEATEIYNSVLAIDPRKVATLNNLANSLLDLGRVDEAVATFRKALRIKPDYHSCRLDYSAALFFVEDWAEAWRCFESRLDVHRIVPSFSFTLTSSGKNVPREHWRTGPQPKSLLVVGEQGIGDNIQFARFLPELVRTGTKVTFMTDQKLFPLLRTLDEPIDFVARHEAISVPNVHAWIPLLSLPAALGMRPGGLAPKSPYLAADPNCAQRWKARLPVTGKRIGLAWSGNPVHKKDHNRSIALHKLMPLLDADVTFVSLQKDVRSEDQALLAEKTNILHFGADLMDFADTAALTSLMDLVITVDTAAAHLAGALAKPVWVLLPFSPDWRWLYKREDSPFYPTARLFRQKTRGEWGEVITRVEAALRNFASGHLK